jgi:ribonuclease BN (tRNA processing enzyme)
MIRRMTSPRSPSSAIFSALALLGACAAPPVGHSGAVEPSPLEASRSDGRTDSSASPRTRVVLLGTGTPNADPERSGPALAVVVDERAYLVDCGPGVVRRAAAAARDRDIPALLVERLEHVFVTHLHSDHTLGLPDLVFTPWTLERSAPLQVFGPPGIAAMVEHVQAAWREDVTVRLDGLQPANDSGWLARAHEIEPGLAYQDELVRVFAFAVPHGSWEHALGFRFETPDRVVVVSGDTAPLDLDDPRVEESLRGADVLVHEVYSAERFASIPPEWQRYHASFHTSTRELALLAERVRPKLLVLTHQLFWGATDEELRAEFDALYDGPFASGRDLDVF